jgi:phosphosulfolactate phosphohydrolase-like enzyme
MIAAILFSIIGLSLISIPFIYAICNVVRNNKKIANEEREYQEQLNSICSGTILKRVREINENPFKIYEQKILVREVKTNTNGEKWIKYSYQDIFNKKGFSQSINYAILKHMLLTYPIIELPKN